MFELVVIHALLPTNPGIIVLVVQTAIYLESPVKINLEVARQQKGIFGRVDAVYTSIEAQKSGGSLHAHSQVYVQCLHQRTTLWDIVTALRKNHGDIVKEYFDCKIMCADKYTRVLGMK